MTATLLWIALFLGNVALFFVWINYIVKVLKGQCPHCGH